MQLGLDQLQSRLSNRTARLLLAFYVQRFLINDGNFTLKTIIVQVDTNIINISELIFYIISNAQVRRLNIFSWACKRTLVATWAEPGYPTTPIELKIELHLLGLGEIIRSQKGRRAAMCPHNTPHPWLMLQFRYIYSYWLFSVKCPLTTRLSQDGELAKKVITWLFCFTIRVKLWKILGGKNKAVGRLNFEEPKALSDAWEVRRGWGLEGVRPSIERSGHCPHKFF